MYVVTTTITKLRMKLIFNFIKLLKLLIDKKHGLQFLKQILKSHFYDYYQRRPCNQI